MSKELRSDLDKAMREIAEAKTRLFEIEQMIKATQQRLETAHKALGEIFAFYKL